MTADLPPSPLSADPTAAYQARMLAIGGKLERAISATSERRINSVWEYTQSVIAVLVVLTTCIGVSRLAIGETNVRMPPEWWTIVGLVIGFYFGRTRPPQAPQQRTGFERDRRDDKAPREMGGPR